MCEETLFNATEAGAEVEQAGALIKVREAAVLAQAEASSAGMYPSWLVPQVCIHLG